MYNIDKLFIIKNPNDLKQHCVCKIEYMSVGDAENSELYVYKHFL